MNLKKFKSLTAHLLNTELTQMSNHTKQPYESTIRINQEHASTYNKVHKVCTLIALLYWDPINTVIQGFKLSSHWLTTIYTEMFLLHIIHF